MRLTQALREQATAVAGVLRSAQLRRLELAWGGFFLVEWCSLLALTVWAYDRGGASAAGLVGLLRMLPAAVALPFGALVTDRFPRNRVLVGVYSAQAVLLGTVAVVIRQHGSSALVYLLVAVVGVVAAPCRPAQLAVVPMLCRTPSELVAANVTAMTFEGLATLLGPAVAGGLLAASGAPLALAAAAAVALASAVLVAGIGGETDPTRVARQTREPVLSALTGGVRELRRLPDLAVLIGGFWAQTLVRGMLNVYIVALAIVTLGLGQGGVGLLSSAFGAGVIVGALFSATLVGRRRLGRPFAWGLALWGLPLAALAAWPNVAVVLVALAVSGIGNAELDVSGFTLMQRLAEDRILGRVFGVMYIGVVGTVGIGSILAPLAIDALGIRGAVAASGALLPLVALLLLRRLARMDDRATVPNVALGAIGALRLFAPLPPTSIEKLARTAVETAVTEGTVVIRRGDEGDRFYVVLDGTLTVEATGAAPKTLRTGDFFGEIALLHEVPRTATVTALTDCTLLAIHRIDFLSAVLGTRQSAEAAEEVIAGRLADTPAAPPETATA